MGGVLKLEIGSVDLVDVDAIDDDDDDVDGDATSVGLGTTLDDSLIALGAVIDRPLGGNFGTLEAVTLSLDMCI